MNINQEEIDKIPMILSALHPMCLWDVAKQRCDEEILYYRSLWIEFFIKYYSNWLGLLAKENEQLKTKLDQLTKQTDVMYNKEI